MTRNNNTLQIGWLVAGIPITVAAMLTVLFLASRRPTVVFVPTGSQVEIAADSNPNMDSGLGIGAQPAGPPPEVKVVRVPALPSSDDPFVVDWDKSPAVELPLQPQQTAPPMLDSATVFNVRVQALRDEKRIAWRLSWADDTPSSNVEVSQFSDQVAIQLPLVDNAPFLMGGKGQPVRLMQWKALWQKDIDEGFQDVKALYPNAWCDLYWFDQIGATKIGSPSDSNTPEFIAKFANEDIARQWLIGVSAGNPMSEQHRVQPVEELAAEGFGTATHVPTTTCAGRGVWREGRWTVVIEHGLDPTDPLTARLLGSNVQNQISLAVWDGSSGNTGGRKHWCPWMPMKMQ